MAQRRSSYTQCFFWTSTIRLGWSTDPVAPALGLIVIYPNDSMGQTLRHPSDFDDPRVGSGQRPTIQAKDPVPPEKGVPKPVRTIGQQMCDSQLLASIAESISKLESHREPEDLDVTNTRAILIQALRNYISQDVGKLRKLWSNNDKTLKMEDLEKLFFPSISRKLNLQYKTTSQVTGKDYTHGRKILQGKNDEEYVRIFDRLAGYAQSGISTPPSLDWTSRIASV